MTEKEWELIQIVRRLVGVVKRILYHPPEDPETRKNIHASMAVIENVMDEEEGIDAHRKN